MNSERTAGKAWTRSAEAPPAGSWIDVLRTQGQAALSRRGLRTLLTVWSVVLLSSVVAGVVLTLVLTLMLGAFTGLPLDAAALAARPESAVQLLLVLAGVLLGGGLDADFQGAQIARDTAFSQVHLTGPVMSYLLVLWWCLRLVYRRSCRSGTDRPSLPAILARTFWEALFTVLVVVPALGFWSPSLALPLSLGVTLQTRWWSLALTVFLVVFLAALTARLQWSRSPERGLMEVVVDETRRLILTFVVVFTVAASAMSAIVLASAPPQPKGPGGTVGMALNLSDPVFLGFIVAAAVLGGGLITWSTVTPPFTALVETPSPFTVSLVPEDSGAGAPVLVGLWILAVFVALRLAVILGLRRRAADDALAARDLSEGRPSGAVEGRARTWDVIRARRRRVGRAVALPVVVTALLVILQQTFVSSVSWFEPVMTPPSTGPAPGYSSGMSLPWYLPLFGGGFTALISAGAVWLPSVLERRAPGVMELLAWGSPELVAWQSVRGAEDAVEEQPGDRRTSRAARDEGSGEVEIRELEYEGPVPDGPVPGRE